MNASFSYIFLSFDGYIWSLWKHGAAMIDTSFNILVVGTYVRNIVESARLSDRFLAMNSFIYCSCTCLLFVRRIQALFTSSFENGIM